MKTLEYLTYIGPNRRSDKTVMEWHLELLPEERQAFQGSIENSLGTLRSRLDEHGIRFPEGSPASWSEPGGVDREAPRELAILVASIAVALQQSAGHRVGFHTVLPRTGTDRVSLLFEYEHSDTGVDAGELAMRLLAETIPGLVWEPDPLVPGTGFAAAFESFLVRSAEHVLPLDTQAIIDAAARLDVPCVKLERAPYSNLPGDFRIRRNGLLKLGHSCHQHIVDGTLCIDRNPTLIHILFDREKLFEYQSELGLPAPKQDREFRNLLTAKRAIRSAEKLTYPVVLKPVTRSRVRGLSASKALKPLGSAPEVQLAFERARASSQRVIVEQYVAGSTFHLLLANHVPICVAVPGGLPVLPSTLHASTLEMAIRVSHALDVGLLVLTLVTPDPGRSLGDVGGAVVDLDPAPQLDRLLPGDASNMAKAAEGFVRWLYPPGAPCRIPLVAVTGTNGKTTTSRMITRIMRTAGFSPGMASTSGVYINEVLHQTGDLAGSGGHHILSESRAINMGVMETARGAVAHSGFMFDWCDVGVCLNVTEEHLGEYGIDTVEQMAVLKRSILERARRAVVLNADYSTCREMLPFAAGVRVYLASVESGVKGKREWASESSFACVLEEQDGEEWVILYEPGGIRLPVMPVAAIPASLDGAARFNISNAQHATCACHALGVGIDIIREGLSTFTSSFENTPGRLNVYRQLPFTVIMDYAHNFDGMEKLCAVVDSMDVPGRKILLYSCAGNRSDEAVAKLARTAIGHFDHFVCRSYPGLRGRQPGEIPALMKAALLDAGIAEDRITTVTQGELGTNRILNMARHGDLIVLSPGTIEIEKMWQEITSFQFEHAH